MLNDRPTITIVGGTFDTVGGLASKYVLELTRHIGRYMNSSITMINGGSIEQLANLPETIKSDVIIWMPNVSNDVPKLVNNVKTYSPHSVLVTSKNNIAGTYLFKDLVKRALDTRSALLLEITKEDSQFATSIIDPLGNMYIDKELDVGRVAWALCNRVKFLLNASRISSYQLPDNNFSINVTDEYNKFINMVRNYAETFHDLIHGANPSRMMGNASFRCENGFPSFRNGDYVCVSRRNIDKRDISLDGFVPVSLSAQDSIFYLGEHKPSVDSPIQVALYRMMPNIRFMIHSHTYVKSSLFTKSVLPCGDMREVDEIMSIVYPEAEYFAVNLKGHGSLVGAKNLLSFEKYIEYVARPAPEKQ